MSLRACPSPAAPPAGSRLPTPAPLGDQALEHDLELRRPQGLQEIVGDPGPQRLDRAVEGRLPGDDDAVAIRVRLAGRAEDLDPVSVGQVDVHARDLGLEVLDRAGRLPAVPTHRVCPPRSRMAMSRPLRTATSSSTMSTLTGPLARPSPDSAISFLGRPSVPLAVGRHRVILRGPEQSVTSALEHLESAFELAPCRSESLGRIVAAASSAARRARSGARPPTAASRHHEKISEARPDPAGRLRAWLSRSTKTPFLRSHSKRFSRESYETDRRARTPDGAERASSRLSPDDSTGSHALFTQPAPSELARRWRRSSRQIVDRRQTQ